MRYRLPSLEALKVFEAVMRHGTLRAAAVELCLTPQAVSHRIKLLEGNLGTALFLRHGHGLIATENARRLAIEVRDGLDLIAHGVERVQAPVENHRLALHVSPYFASAYLIPNLSEFTARDPLIDLRISIGADLVEFSARGLDAAIHWCYEAPPGFEAIPLLADLKVLVCQPALFAQRPLLEGADLLDHRLIAPLVDNTLWPDVLALFGIDRAPSQGMLRLHTHEAMFEATLAGLGVGLASHRDALEAIAAGRLVAPFGEHLLRRLPRHKTPHFQLLYPHGRAPSKLLLAFRDWMLARTSELGREIQQGEQPASAHHPG
ncbi:LysR substrate-binding domain-containing protein [Halotalea alkalilenta]|uniref:HTH lysR-type domain-containing protein n=1 Tax=Halotalea alkalilenta TaxID=376489 RepID=A0A172YCF2_9GAMM|nr:LysR substrate-binding domain-containing protein [Halotalea alkalilenta]ANF56796.1 hypothetical protein A5892_04370 [Halotalea alkalilenta]